MSKFQNYSKRDLAAEDRAGLAAALTTIYLEGMGRFPPNPKWDDHWWNQYSIGYIPGSRSFITINASEGESDIPDRFMIFSINTNRQAVTWKMGKHASSGTPVPEHLQPFLRQLTATVHGIAAKREQNAELQRQSAKARAEQEKKYYEENKERIDAERFLERKKMDEEQKKRKENAAKDELKQKIKRRKHELVHASRIMKWKASASELTDAASTTNEHPTMSNSDSLGEEPTKIDKMMRSARRGPEHDLCETCAETLDCCLRKGCNVIGCIECFEEKVLVCASCNSFVCYQHGIDFNQCCKCENYVCEPCGGQNCRLCDQFACYDCSTCGLCDIPLDEEAYLFSDDFGDDYDDYCGF